MAEPGAHAGQGGVTNHLDLVQTTLEKHYAAVQQLLESAQRAAEQTPTGMDRTSGEGPPLAVLSEHVLPGMPSTPVAQSVRPPRVSTAPCMPLFHAELQPVNSSLPLSPPNNVERTRRMTAIRQTMTTLREETRLHEEGETRPGHQSRLFSVVTLPFSKTMSDKTEQGTRSTIRSTRMKHGVRFTVGGDYKRSVFAHRDTMRQKVWATIGDLQYNVTNAYKDQGIAQQIAKSPWFETITLCVIVVNAMWMGLDTDLNDDYIWLEAHPVYAVMENLFCAFFAAEILIRYFAFKVKSLCLRDTWFIFDSMIVFLMVSETWIVAFIVRSGLGSSAGADNVEILRLVRLLRITRMARLARVLKATPELMILVKGMAAGFRSVCSTLGLMLILIYIFAILFRMMGKDTKLEPLGFKTVPQTMLTLLVRGVLDPDLHKFTYELVAVEIVYAIILYIFILLASVTVMNMLIGVLVEVVAVVSTVEKEHIEVNYVRKQLEGLSRNIDKDANGLISKVEFEALLTSPEAVRALLSIDVDVVGLVDYIDYIFQDDMPITFAHFMEVLLELRGSQKARVKDIVDLRKIVMEKYCRLEESVLSLQTPATSQ